MIDGSDAIIGALFIFIIVFRSDDCENRKSC